MPVKPTHISVIHTQVASTYSLFYLSFERSSACSLDLESQNGWGDVWRKVTDKTTRTKCCPVFPVQHVNNAKPAIYMIYCVYTNMLQHPNIHPLNTHMVVKKKRHLN